MGFHEIYNGQTISNQNCKWIILVWLKSHETILWFEVDGWYTSGT